jgi:hypothetical protein
MKTVSVQVPESAISPAAGSEEGATHESQCLLALKLFELGRLSTAEAAALCGMNAVDFLLFAEHSFAPPEGTLPVVGGPPPAAYPPPPNLPAH